MPPNRRAVVRRRIRLPPVPKEQAVTPSRDPVRSQPGPTEPAETNAQATKLAPRVANAITEPRGTGRSLSPDLRNDLESRFGVGLDAIRIHDDVRADALARTLGAQAFTTGTDVFFQRGGFAPDDPSGRRLLAHELAHAVQPAPEARGPGLWLVTDDAAEAEADRVAEQVTDGHPGAGALDLAAPPRPAAAGAVQRYPDPTRTQYSAATVTPLSNADLLAAVSDLRRALTSAGPEETTTPGLWDNLSLLLTHVRQRQLAIGDNEAPSVAGKPDELAAPGHVNALDVHYEAIDAQVQKRLGPQAVTLRARIAQRRGWLLTLHRDAVLDEGARIEALEVALLSWQQSKAIVPAKPTGDQRIAVPEQNLRRALDFSAETLLSNAQQDGIGALELARTDYLSGFARLLLMTAHDLKTQLRNSALRDIPMVSNYEEGINTRTPGGPWEGRDDLREYRASLDRLTTALDAHGDLAVRAAAGPVDRLKYLVDHGDALMNEVGLVQALMVAGQGIALVAYFQDATSSQLKAFDHVRINDMRREIIEPMIAALRNERAPDPAVLDEAQFRLEIASPEPTDKEGNPDPAAVADQRRRHRERRAARGLSGDEPEDLTRRRLREIAEFERNFGIFVGIAASIIGAVAAAGAVGAVMRTAVFSRGGALAAGQGIRVGAIRFAVQSLTFTFASQTMQAALYGRLPKPSDVAKAAAMDALTLGFMHGIGLPFTKIGRQPPTALQFGALWAWSSAWQLGGLVWRGQLTLGSAAKAMALSGVETALMLKALEVAHRIGVLPTPDGLGNWFRPRSAEQHAALQNFLTAQKKGQAVREDAVAWERGERRPEGLDAILERSQAFMGEYRTALDRMRTSGLLPEAEIGPIIEQAAAQTGEIRNLRDAMRLGLAPSGPNMVRYSGTVQNLMVYLQRLRGQGVVTGTEPIGRAGVVAVTYADGTVRHFYPQGAGTTAMALDLLLESVQRALPAGHSAQHLLVLESLRRLPADAAARLAAVAESSPHASTVLDFMARPEVAIELSRPVSLYSEQLLTAALAGDAAALHLLARTESPLALQRWYQTEFERLEPSAGRDLGVFFRFLDAVRLYRGTLDVANLGEAREVASALAEADTVSRYLSRPRSQVPAATISVPGQSVGPSVPTPSPADFFLRQGRQSDLLQFQAGALEWYVSVDGAGRPLQAWVFQPRSASPVGQLDVAGPLNRLREGIKQLDALGPGQDTQARALVDSLVPLARSLIFLRRMRGYDIAAELAVLDRIELDPRGSKPRAAPPAIDVAGPLAPPKVGPGALFDPVTPSEILSQRQRSLQGRAGRMGRSADGPVQAGLAAQIRTPLSLNEQASVRSALETAEKHLDQLAESAYAEVSRRLGQRRFATVLRNVFRGRTPIEVGEALRFMTEQPGFTDAALEGLARMNPRDRVLLGGLDPALLSALGEIAATSPETVSRLLKNQGEFLRDLQRSPGLAARFIRLTHLLQGGLPFADPHRHLFGGIEYPQLLVAAMAETTSMTFGPKFTGLREITKRVEALDVAFKRLNRAGDAIAAALPPGHPGTEAYLREWSVARPLVETYRDLLRESIQKSQCMVAQQGLEQRLLESLTRAFTLPAETAQRGPQGDAFFILFRELSRVAPKQRVLPAHIALAAGQRVVYVELRAGLEKDVRAQLAAQGVMGPDGSVLPDVRLVITLPRGRLKSAEVEQTLNGLGSLRNRVVGIDLSGVESAPLPVGELVSANGIIAKMNFTALATMIGANPALLADVTGRLGLDPVATGRALTVQIEAGTAPAAGAPHPVVELARLNRRVKELVSEFDARDGTSRLPDTLLGTTIHAGEQVRSDARIDMLINDVRSALNAGTDRIGHGIVLGFPLPHGLAELGFTAHPDGSWSRPTAQGGQPESYTAAQLAGMESQRLELIRRIGDENVTLEIAPTSNIVVSGLSTAAHPLARLLQTRPNLRVAVATDNPAIHLTDPARELAIASAVSGASHAQMVRIYLEGFSSRLGARGIGNAATVREWVREALVVATPASQRPYVLLELQARYGIDPGVASSAPITSAEFAAYLTPFLDRAIR